MIRLLIAEDHGVVRAGLARLLDGVADFEVVAVAGDGDEAVALASEHRPDVVLMDLRMPGVDGSEATRRLLELHTETQVVILTSFSEREQIMRALDAGAIGYLLKDAEPEELIRGVRAAAAGDRRSRRRPRARSSTPAPRPRSMSSAPGRWRSCAT